MTPLQRQSGATLIEVLVAIIVLSLGLLGMAGLQAASLKVNQGALQRSQVALLAYDMIDRMRANPGAIYNIGLTDSAPTGTSISAVDIATWRRTLVNALGAGATGSVCLRGDTTDVICGTGSVAVVTVQWLEADLSGGAGVTNGRITQTITFLGRIR